jgi:hypothetical protein
MNQAAPPRAPDPLVEALPELRNFSLVLGGPLYQLLRKARLDDDVTDHLRQRILWICAIIWLPLVVLCALNGTLLGGIQIPFLVDVETHARLLIGVPLMILAEYFVHLRIRGVVAQFVERGLIPPEATERFRAAISGAMKWRNSVAAELALLVIVLTAGYYLRATLFALDVSTWYATASPEGATLTLPGYWFTWVSTPLTQFLILRWLFRLAIWGRFLWQVSRIDLELIPTHPDRNCGLGFLGGSAYAFSPLLASLSAMVAGLVASRIFHNVPAASLADFKVEIVVLVGLGIVLVLGPLTVFAPQILAAKRRGLREYGAFAADYTRDFHRRWLCSADHDAELLLGTGDIQSLADLGNAFSVIKEIKAVPFSRDMLLQLVWATLVPFAPLVFTMIPLDELLDRIIGAVF